MTFNGELSEGFYFSHLAVDAGIFEIRHKQPSSVTVGTGAFHVVLNALLSPNNVSSTSIDGSIAISSKFKPAKGSSVNACGLFCWKVQDVGDAQFETFSSSTIKFRFAA